MVKNILCFLRQKTDWIPVLFQSLFQPFYIILFLSIPKKFEELENCGVNGMLTLSSLFSTCVRAGVRVLVEFLSTKEVYKSWHF